MKDGQEWIMRLTLDNETMTANVERVGEIIRCKECKYWGADGYNDRCKYMTYIVCENDYCSNAERKEE